MALQAGTKLSRAAAEEGLLELKLLINGGEKINDYDKWGWTPLMWAVHSNQEKVVKWLLVHGADPNLKSTAENRSCPKGNTALGIAVTGTEPTLVPILLAAKADPKALDARGGSPLGLADVFVQIDSCLPDSGIFLDDVKKALNPELEKWYIRHLVCVMYPKDKDEINAARTASIRSSSCSARNFGPRSPRAARGTAPGSRWRSSDREGLNPSGPVASPPGTATTRSATAAMRSRCWSRPSSR